LFLYGNNEEKISKRSLKQEIENLWLKFLLT
jgi:hypothetical protein